MDGKSLDTVATLKEKLSALIPEAFAEGKIDWEKLKAVLGEDINFSNERYVLNWAGKSDAFKVMQTPTTKTLVPAKDESVNFDETENIFIEGENLEVLKTLQKSYFGKIKMIYIDPPYNTGKDSFIYPDKFSETKEEYLKRVGDKDEEGYMTKDGMFHKNSKENGQYHSNWLNMMYPRLFMAKNLMKDDGVIFVSIDDNEVQNLKLLMNEIFGEENWIGTVVWKNATDNNPTQVAIEHEYMHVYSKNKNSLESEWKSSLSDVKDKLIEIGEKLISENKDLSHLQANYSIWYKENKSYLWPLDRYKYIDFGGVYTGSQSVHNPGKEGYRYDIIHPKTKKPCKQPLMGYRFPETTMNELIENDKIIFGEDEEKIIELKVYAKDFLEKFSSVLELDGRLGSYDLKGLFENSKRIFNNPKPLRFLESFFPFVLKEEDIMLDFFSGSSSTAHTVLNLNSKDNGKRKFICVQLPEECEVKSEAYKAGYQNIADVSKERIRRVIDTIKNEREGELDFSDDNIDLGFKVFKLSESNFKQWQPKPKSAEELAEQMKLFVNPINGEPTNESMAFELLLKSGLNLNSSIEEKEGFYLINENELALVLEEINESVFSAIATHSPKRVIALDTAFKDNDQLKTNAALQLKDAGIDFKTI